MAGHVDDCFEIPVGNPRVQSIWLRITEEKHREMSLAAGLMDK